MAAKPTKWINMTAEFTPEGLAVMKAGKLLVFDYEGSRIKFKVMRVTKDPINVWVKEVETYNGEEAQAYVDQLEGRTNRAMRRKGKK